MSYPQSLCGRQPALIGLRIADNRSGGVFPGMRVAGSCRRLLGIVETKGELFATSATRQRRAGPAKSLICWQLSRDRDL